MGSKRSQNDTFIWETNIYKWDLYIFKRICFRPKDICLLWHLDKKLHLQTACRLRTQRHFCVKCYRPTVTQTDSQMRCFFFFQQGIVCIQSAISLQIAALNFSVKISLLKILTNELAALDNMAPAVGMLAHRIKHCQATAKIQFFRDYDSIVTIW